MGKSRFEGMEIAIREQSKIAESGIQDKIQIDTLKMNIESMRKLKIPQLIKIFLNDKHRTILILIRLIIRESMIRYFNRLLIILIKLPLMLNRSTNKHRLILLIRKHN